MEAGPVSHRRVEFLFHRDTLLRWILYAMGAAGLVALANAAQPGAAAPDYGRHRDGQGHDVRARVSFGLGFMVWVAPFAACCLAIVEDTANGYDESRAGPTTTFWSGSSRRRIFRSPRSSPAFRAWSFGSFARLQRRARRLYRRWPCWRAGRFCFRWSSARCSRKARSSPSIRRRPIAA